MKNRSRKKSITLTVPRSAYEKLEKIVDLLGIPRAEIRPTIVEIGLFSGLQDHLHLWTENYVFSSRARAERAAAAIFSDGWGIAELRWREGRRDVCANFVDTTLDVETQKIILRNIEEADGPDAMVSLGLSSKLAAVKTLRAA